MAKSKDSNRPTKDSNKPKKALSAFMFFCNDKRAGLNLKNVGECAKKLGEMWKALSESDRKQYQAQYDADKVRYAKAMESYVPPPAEKPVSQENSEESNVAPKKAKRVKDANAVPRKPSGYLMYGAEERTRLKKENPEVKSKDVMTQIGASWKALTEAQRTSWNERAKAN